MRCLVTGGSGFFGHLLLEKLLDRCKTLAVLGIAAAGLLFLAGTTPGGSQKQGRDKAGDLHAAHFMECARACGVCASECESCATRGHWEAASEAGGPARDVHRP